MGQGFCSAMQEAYIRKNYKKKIQFWVCLGWLVWFLPLEIIVWSSGTEHVLQSEVSASGASGSLLFRLFK